MPQFISKLQHKTYEKGEFVNEQPRTLEETIALIKTFPWDEERPLTDVQLTGPSVTIKNENGEYLKIGLYFSGKFCLYLLDKGNHVYEYHAPDIENICSIVTDYFNGTLDLQKFDKHLFNIGSAKHFISQTFEYRFNKTSFVLNYISLCIFTLLLFSILGVFTSRYPVVGIVSIAAVFFCYKFHNIYLNHYYKAKDSYLQLAQGASHFLFGKEGAIKTYQKADIKGIDVWNASGRGKLLAVYQITFKDDTYIRTTGFVIRADDFTHKFPGINIKYIRNNGPVAL